MSTDNDPASKTHIIVIPSSVEFVEQMEELQRIVYGYTAGEEETFPDYLTAAHFRSHLDIFPEGQFIALEKETGRVVGLTASMRIDFDPSLGLQEPWWVTTDYG
jgi:hypothetical protein